MDYPLLFLARPLWAELRGRTVRRVSWNGPVLMLALTGLEEELALGCHQEEQGVHLEPSAPSPGMHFRFQDQRHDFSFLPDHLEGTRFEGGGPLPGESLLRLDFLDAGKLKEDRNLHLFLECFAGGRLVLTDGARKVIRASRKGGLQVKPGAEYRLGLGELAIPGKDLPSKAPILSDWPSREALGKDAKRVKGLAPSTLAYLVENQGDMSPAEALSRLTAWRGPWKLSLWPPEAFQPGSLLPADAADAEGAETEELPDFLPALHRLGAQNRLRRQLAEMEEGLRRHHQARRERLSRLETGLAADRERAAGADLLRRQADTLAAHLTEIRRGEEIVELEDVHTGEPLLIELNPGDGPRKNLDRLYKRAAKGERGLESIEERLADCRRDLRASEKALAALEPVPGESLEERAERLLPAWLAAFPPPKEKPKKQAQPEAQPFRRYELPGGWQVWVGRNNRENDELTHRAASPNDIWMHAHAVPGSHVVLRTGGHKGDPPAAVLEAAASIAAHYSKARNSKLVPVIWTRKRYVRKPRKAPAGQALCERETSIIVPPRLPEGQ